jgi:hypothetical protein
VHERRGARIHFRHGATARAAQCGGLLPYSVVGVRGNLAISRPKDELGIRELARSYEAEAIETLAEIMKEYQRELCGFGGNPQRRNEWADRYVTEH